VKFFGILPRKRNADESQNCWTDANASQHCWASSRIAKKWEKSYGEGPMSSTRCCASLIHIFILTSQLMLSGEKEKWHRRLVVSVRSTSPPAAGPQPPGSKVTRTFEVFCSIDAFQVHPAAVSWPFPIYDGSFHCFVRGGISPAHHKKMALA
jgi:hypothetical protein